MTTLHNSSPHNEIVFFVNSDDIRAQIDSIYSEVKSKLLELNNQLDIHHIGSTAIPNSLTKGDLDILCLVSKTEFDITKHQFTQEFIVNSGNDGLAGFASFECDDYEISIGIQLKSNVESQPPFLAWKELQLNDKTILNEYNDLKWQFQGKSMQDYRNAKEKLICKYLPENL